MQAINLFQRNRKSGENNIHENISARFFKNDNEDFGDLFIV
jgi:hypothetical protein